MGKRYISPYAQCPFYKSEERQKIMCEGVDDNSTIHLAFCDPSKKTSYRKRTCCDKYDRCVIAQALGRKYE